MMPENIVQPLSNKGKLPIRVKLGYASGQLTDSFAYNMFYVVFFYFLTQVAGIGAGKAGTIILISVFFDAIADPVVGHLSDNLKSRWGRRRPMMIGALLPFSILLFLLFMNVPTMGIELKAVYFTVVAILFWTAYKIFVIPYFALGAEMTDDFDERTSLRVWAGFALYVAVVISGSLPLYMVSFFQEHFDLSTTGSWSVVGGLFAVATFVSGIICWYMTRGWERTAQEPLGTDATNKNGFLSFVPSLLSSMKAILKLSSSYYLAASVFLWSGVTAMSSMAILLLLEHSLGYGGDKIVLIMAIYGFLALGWLPIVNFTSGRFDKKILYCTALGVSAIGIIAFYLIGLKSLPLLIIYFIFLQLGNSYFWTLYYSMMYDISELDEFVSGQRREGAITALMSFVQKIGAGVAVWVAGLYLGMKGLAESNGDEIVQQPASALSAILELNTWIPGVLGIAATLFALAYPLTHKRFDALMKALEAKRAHQPYTTESFEKLL